MNRLNQPASLSLDMIRYDVREIKFADAVKLMKGLTPEMLKAFLFKGFQFRIPPMTNPTIFYIVTKDQDEDAKTFQMAQNLEQKPEQDLNMLNFGSSRMMALDKDECVAKFEALVKAHNEE